MKLNPERAEALVRLRAMPEFQAVLGMVAEYAEAKNEQLIMSDDLNVDVTIGELRSMTRLMSAVDKAPSYLKQSTEEYADGTPRSST